VTLSVAAAVTLLTRMPNARAVPPMWLSAKRLTDVCVCMACLLLPLAASGGGGLAANHVHSMRRRTVAHIAVNCYLAA
jgi:hypothetical protein